MRIRRPFLAPVPTGFDDPVKRAAAHAEREWEAMTALCAASAAITAMSAPPVAAILGAVGALSALFKLRSKWAKEDPPRSDYYRHAVLAPLEVDPLVLENRFLSGPILVLALDRACAYVGAVTTAIERAEGAANDNNQYLAYARAAEAYGLARHAKSALETVDFVCMSFRRDYARFFSGFTPELYRESVGSQLDERLQPDQLSAILSAGVPRELVSVSIPETDPENYTPELITRAGAAATVFGRALGDWGAGGMPGFSPEGAPLPPNPFEPRLYGDQGSEPPQPTRS
jgi:hypothetical protein